MPANKPPHYGQIDSDYPPFSASGTYCRAVFPLERDATFADGRILPQKVTQAAGSCGFTPPALSQAESHPTWDLPSLTNVGQAFGLTQYWSTQDSALTGDAPHPGGWRQPKSLRVHPDTQVQSGGKRKQTRKAGKKTVKGKKGTKRGGRAGRRGRSGRGGRKGRK